MSKVDNGNDVLTTDQSQDEDMIKRYAQIIKENVDTPLTRRSGIEENVQEEPETMKA